MPWIELVILALLLFTVANLIDKFVMTEELTDPILGTTIVSFISFIILIITPLALDRATIDLEISIIGITTGFIASTGLWFYFKSLVKEEASRVIPILGIVPLIVLPFGYILFEETFTQWKYLGIFLVIIGSIVLSLERKTIENKLNKLMVFIFIAAVFFAFRNVLIKLGTQQVGIWSVLMWVGIGQGITSVLLTVKHHPHIKGKTKKGIRHLIISGTFSSIAMVALYAAISTGPVSLVSSLMALQPAVIFILATLITILHPSFIREKLTKPAIIQKTISITMLVAGGILITIF